MIWMTGPDKKCIFVSGKWLEFTGASPEEALGEEWTNFVHQDDCAALLQAFHTAFNDKYEFSHEYRLRHRDGGLRWVQDSGSPRFDTHHQFSGFTGSVWDLSEQKRASDEAHKATRYARLIQEVAAIANSATTLQEALQRSVNSICETMGFPVGHALLITDEEPGVAKPGNIVYLKDPERFKTLREVARPHTWPAVKDLSADVLHAGKPAIRDIVMDSLAPADSPRLAAAYDAGLRGGAQLPIVVDGKVEAIFEFGCDEAIADDKELFDTLTVATERLARFFERRRARIKFSQQKRELQDSADRLFAMAGRLVDSQEEERRRIARDIHDDFTQRLALVSMKIGSLVGNGRAAMSAEIDAGLEDIRKTTSAVASDLRDLSHRLHPAMLELLGLIGALRAQCEDFQRTSGIETSFKSSADDKDASDLAATCLYRVLQECLMNVAKHSGSASAVVILSRDADQLEMNIRDSGRGIESEAEERMGIGLTGIEERVPLLNGKLIVNSKPGFGTEIVVTVPAQRTSLSL
jgi:two-component system, NarL family, sensor kinase